MRTETHYLGVSVDWKISNEKHEALQDPLSGVYIPANKSEVFEIVKTISTLGNQDHLRISMSFNFLANLNGIVDGLVKQVSAKSVSYVTLKLVCHIHKYNINSRRNTINHYSTLGGGNQKCRSPLKPPMST